MGLVLWADPEGGQGVRTPPPHSEKSQNIGFLCNTGPDPLKNHKATKLGPSSWCFTGGPMMVQLKQYLDPLSPYQQKKKR